MQNYGGTITWKPFCKEHAWGEWTVTTEPTCTEKGEETRTCTVCKVTETREVDALNHKWDDGVITTEPTEDAEGEKPRSKRSLPSVWPGFYCDGPYDHRLEELINQVYKYSKIRYDISTMEMLHETGKE